jgi:hypothetical protein
MPFSLQFFAARLGGFEGESCISKQLKWKRRSRAKKSNLMFDKCFLDIENMVVG